MSITPISTERDYARMTKILLNSWPSLQENADMCISAVNGHTYLCVRINNKWYKVVIQLQSFQPDILTTQLTSITHTAPGTPDYAIQDLTQTTPFGFVTKDEGNTVLKVIANLQTRISELEGQLKSVGVLR